MAEKKIKVGLVGIGRAGWGMHSKEIEKYSDLYELVAAMDPEAARLDEMKKRFEGCKTYQDFDQFLKDKNVELVVIANRSPEHTPYALKALQAGKYVFVEKPIALSYDEAKPVGFAQFYRVASLSEIDEVRAFNGLSVLYVKAWYDTFCQSHILIFVFQPKGPIRSMKFYPRKWLSQIRRK